MELLGLQSEEAVLFRGRLLLLECLLSLTFRDSLLSNCSLLWLLCSLLLPKRGLLGVLLSGGNNLHKLLNLGLKSGQNFGCHGKSSGRELENGRHGRCRRSWKDRVCLEANGRAVKATASKDAHIVAA